MNEQEFEKRFRKDQPKLRAWGNLVTETICAELNKQLPGGDLRALVQIPPSARVKELDSALDKAFTRKPYEDPYEEMTDKVGVRFVTILTDDIERIANIVMSVKGWAYSDDRDFIREQAKDPDIFCYQSRHFVVRPKKPVKHGRITIPAGMPCEIQIRSMLQHVYSEVTHKTIYKSKLTKPTTEMRRLVARSMALLETTDSMLTSVKGKADHEIAGHIKLNDELASIYFDVVGLEPIRGLKSEGELIEIFFDDLKGKSKAIRAFFEKNKVLTDCIKSNIEIGKFFQLSVVVGLYFIAEKRRHYIRSKWPFESREAVLEQILNDLGISAYTD